MWVANATGARFLSVNDARGLELVAGSQWRLLP